MQKGGMHRCKQEKQKEKKSYQASVFYNVDRMYDVELDSM